MPNRKVTIACILALACGSIIFSLCYGPLRRSYVSPPQVVSIASTADLYKFCTAQVIRGRVALFFARNLITAEKQFVSPEVNDVDQARHHGIVRETFHVVPDSNWPETRANLAMVSIYWPSTSGFEAAFEDGRINVIPFSRLWPIGEKVLIIVDPAVWSPEELLRIAGLVRSGGISSDLIAILRGSPSDLTLFRAALPSTH